MARKKTAELPAALEGLEFSRPADDLIGVVINYLERVEGEALDSQRVADLCHALVDRRLAK